MPPRLAVQVWSKDHQFVMDLVPSLIDHLYCDICTMDKSTSETGVIRGGSDFAGAITHHAFGEKNTEVQ